MYDKRMERLPVLISYPRSGSNWLNAVVEIYFNRPRLRVGPSSFIKKSNKNYMWFHDHDILSKLKLSHNNIAYLYRDPSDVIYSLLRAEKKEINDKTVNKQIKLLQNHYIKYLKNSTRCIIKYENLLSSPHTEFAKFIKFLDKSSKVDIEKLQKCINAVSKEKIINKQPNNQYFTKELITKKYSDDREIFKEVYRDNIVNNLMINFEQYFA